MDFGDQRAVRPVGDGRRGEGWKLGEIRQLGERGRMRAKHRLVDVPNQLKQPALVVDQQHDGVVGVNHPLVAYSHDFLLISRVLSLAPRHRDVCISG